MDSTIHDHTVEPEPHDRASLEAKHGPVWDTEELTRDFEVVAFCAPFVEVRRKDTGRMGVLEFIHHPRYYFNFVPEDEWYYFGFVAEDEWPK